MSELLEFDDAGKGCPLSRGGQVNLGGRGKQLAPDSQKVLRMGVV